MEFFKIGNTRLTWKTILTWQEENLAFEFRFYDFPSATKTNRRIKKIYHSIQNNAKLIPERRVISRKLSSKSFRYETFIRQNVPFNKSITSLLTKIEPDSRHYKEEENRRGGGGYTQCLNSKTSSPFNSSTNRTPSCRGVRTLKKHLHIQSQINWKRKV